MGGVKVGGATETDHTGLEGGCCTNSTGLHLCTFDASLLPEVVLPARSSAFLIWHRPITHRQWRNPLLGWTLNSTHATEQQRPPRCSSFRWHLVIVSAAPPEFIAHLQSCRADVRQSQSLGWYTRSTVICCCARQIRFICEQKHFVFELVYSILWFLGTVIKYYCGCYCRSGPSKQWHTAFNQYDTSPPASPRRHHYCI